jgi:DNA-binding GntR family transcriptional regulator
MAELEAAFTALKAAHVEANAMGVIKEKQAFYQTLFRTADNSVITEVAHKLYARTTRVRLVAYTRQGRIAEGLSELEDVMAAIRRGDRDQAAEAYAAHMANAEAAAVLALSQ